MGTLPRMHLDTQMRPKAQRSNVKLPNTSYQATAHVAIPDLAYRRRLRSHSVLEAFSSLKKEVISTLNYTCSCLRLYFSRTLLRRHLGASGRRNVPQALQMTFKMIPKWTPSCLLELSSKPMSKNMTSVKKLRPF